MEFDIRVLQEDQWPDFVRAAFVPFGGHATEEDIRDSRVEFEPGRSLAVFDRDQIVGTTSVISLQMTVPGRAQVPAAGVTTVGVAPTHRRRGMLRALMRRQLDDSRDHGDVLSALWASEAPIYQRFGYGTGTRAIIATVSRDHASFLRPLPDPGRVRLLPFDDAMKELAPVYERVRAETPGMIERNHDWWVYRFRHEDSEHHRQGGWGKMFFALHEGPEGPDAYAVYRVKLGDEDGVDIGAVQVVEAMATSPASTQAMWSYVFGIDLVRTIEFWNRPVDDPLFSMALDVRRFGIKVIDGMWIRLLDVPAALSARTYGSEGRVVLEVRDEICPWNEGRFELVGGPGGAECRATDGDPDLVLTANELGAAYLGGTRLGNLLRAGRIEELTPGAVATADAMFAGDRDPWCPHQF
ncbi:MAG TPA: GNAT family N-acetyltransferase [Actinomycetota bacterium]